MFYLIKRLLLAFAFFSVHCYCAQKTEVLGQKSQEDPIVRKLADELGFPYPTAENCGAAVNAQGVDRPLAKNFNGNILCMMEGFKKVAWFPKRLFDSKIDQLPSEIKSFIESDVSKLEYAKVEKDHELFRDVILFSPNGKTNALLLYKYRMSPITNEYLFGHLLGYKDEDIQAFFSKPLEENKNLSLEQKKKFSEKIFMIEKQRAMKWIQENLPIIEQWAAEQKKSQE